MFFCVYECAKSNNTFNVFVIECIHAVKEIDYFKHSQYTDGDQAYVDITGRGSSNRLRCIVSDPIQVSHLSADGDVRVTATYADWYIKSYIILNPCSVEGAPTTTKE